MACLCVIILGFVPSLSKYHHITSNVFKRIIFSIFIIWWTNNSSKLEAYTSIIGIQSFCCQRPALRRFKFTFPEHCIKRRCFWLPRNFCRQKNVIINLQYCVNVRKRSFKSCGLVSLLRANMFNRLENFCSKRKSGQNFIQV